MVGRRMATRIHFFQLLVTIWTQISSRVSLFLERNRFMESTIRQSLQLFLKIA